MYTEQFEVYSHDVDARGIARPSSILRYMQEAANHQMRDEKPSYAELFREGKAFLLSRIAVETFSPLMQYDKLIVSNWPAGGKGATFYRCYRIERAGQCVARGLGVWALVDTRTRRLYRVGEVSFPNYTQGALVPVDGLRFRLPEEMEAAGAHEVAYHETDLNRHLNNTHYPDLLLDCLPERDTHYVAGFSIHFLAEAPLGERLTVYRSAALEGPDGLTRYFRTERASGGENVEAVLRLAPAPSLAL
jgi:medium-chain acyl-[acyl-carrier-protein] hydrolase